MSDPNPSLTGDLVEAVIYPGAPPRAPHLIERDINEASTLLEKATAQGALTAALGLLGLRAAFERELAAATAT